ncbi:MAG: VWA domain-containing protein [Acidobacteria bacterium]|nr:VWA domain-containing protein [Acidobacteriota bacterium]
MSVRRLKLASAMAVAICAMPALPRARQAPVFRAAADLVAVDVRVVTAAGEPVLGLAPDAFDVSINGRRRRLVTADFVGAPRAATAGASNGAVATPPGGVAPPAPAVTQDGRTFVIALDVMSLRSDAIGTVLAAAREFVGALPPADRVGVFTFPGGAGLDPTIDRRAVAKALERTAGIGDAPLGIGNPYQLLPSQLADITGARQREPSVSIRNPPANTTLGRIVNQVCAFDRDPEQCKLVLVAEAEKLAVYEEGLALQRIGALRGLLGRLATQPGPKTVVLISDGILQTDVPGGRPELGDLGLLVGREAARADATIYALYVDRQRTDLAAAASGARRRPIDNPQRDSGILARPLDQIAGPSGGRVFTLVQGGGEPFFARILSETSAHYLLGVEPADADRDGEPRHLTVKVKGLPRGAVVRARAWVVVPQRAPAGPAAAAAAAPPPARASIWDPVPPTPSERPRERGSIWDPVPPSDGPPRVTALDEIYAAYAAGQSSVIGERLRTREDFERIRPDVMRGLARWRQDWTPRRAAFALELSIAAIARHWPNPLGFVTSAREIVTSRPDPPGRNPEDDRFEMLFHRSAVAVLASVDAPREVEAYLEAIADRVATDGRPPTAARLVDSRLSLARAAARERLTLPATSARRASAAGAPWSWVATPEAREERRRLQDVLDLLDVAALVGTPDAATRDEIAVRRAFVSYRLGHYAEALAILDGHPAADPLVASWRDLLRGRTLAALNRLDDAAAAYEQAARLAPGAQTAAVALASIRLRLGDREGAERWAAIARTMTAEPDPWTTYWTADSRFLPAWIADLRHGRP